MSKADARTEAIDTFIARWQGSGGGELANSQSFLVELCDRLGVAPPDPATDDPTRNAYTFERRVDFHNPDGSTSTGRIDLYKRGCFVLESKQGTERKEENALSDAVKARRKRRKKGTATRGTAGWNDAMLCAHGQGVQYIRALPVEDGRPPFLIIVDVGYCIELYSEFTCTGGTYVPFPDPRSHRIMLDDLKKPEVIERLRKVWTEPLSLDPSKRAARVTREIADKLAQLAKSLEARHNAEDVANFLMRCIFTMFAEDTRMLPKGSFTAMLESLADAPADFAPVVEDLWEKMKTGGYSAVLREKVLHFNGYLFDKARALPLTEDQIRLLIESGKHDWTDVEPAIFGTLLERALDPHERHKLGAHYTPRAYVERLVMPTIVEPLREEWRNVQAAAVQLERDDQTREAIAEVDAFHKRLCKVRVLDPACGSGNFLYVTMEHLKRIEGEVLNTLNDLRGQGALALEGEGYAVDPHQFLGLEVNTRAAAIAELVLWIGYLQWHYRTRGDIKPPEPVIRNFHNIECRDAVLEWDSVEEVIDEDGKPVTRWDGRTTKTHPVTGEDVPDETARVPVYKYNNPRKADWPEAEFIVGNPPFIGTAMMREALGDGYAETIRKVHNDCPASCDYVMYWWNIAAERVRTGKAQRFGFITTNSLRQTFNRRVLQPHLSDAKQPLSLLFAIPDHPWVDASDGAAVRISMTVGTAGEHPGKHFTVAKESESGELGKHVEFNAKVGIIQSDLTVGADVAGTEPLLSNAKLSCPGVKLHGAGFIVTPEQARSLGLGRVEGLEQHVRNYRNGRDITATSRGVMVIDLFGLTADEVLSKYPAIYQWVTEHVRAEREGKAGRTKDSQEYAKKWWLHGKPRQGLRKALCGLPRYIATVETMRRRAFLFLDEVILPDNKLVAIAVDDAYFLGTLSSTIHVTWSLAAGSWLGVGNDSVYSKTTCFETFPFPDATEEQKARIRELGEALDAHRKARQAEHPKLTLTNIYNVLEKLRSGEELTAKEKKTHEEGLVSVLKQIHDDLDAAVADAYGWPSDLSDEEILERIVALNKERAAEEAAGHIRWLRPDYQCPQGAKEAQGTLVTTAAATPTAATKKVAKQDWPESLSEQVQAVRAALQTLGAPADADALAACFTRMTKKRKERLAELLDTLTTLGQLRETDDGLFLAA